MRQRAALVEVSSDNTFAIAIYLLEVTVTAGEFEDVGVLESSTAYVAEDVLLAKDEGILAAIDEDVGPVGPAAAE